ncbi:MAG: zinc ABC transporter substrate-binding protein [Candidatus Puniceispirillum sp.]
MLKWAMRMGAIAGVILVGFAQGGVTAADDKLRVVASIRPVAALVGAVMGDVGQPALLISDPAAAHHFTVKPSQARLLQDADLVFWIGPPMETTLGTALAGLAPDVPAVPLIDSDGLTRYPLDVTDHDNGPNHSSETAQPHHAHHDHAVNPHIWLDPRNVVILLHHVADRLAAADPAHKASYQANARNAAAEIEATIAAMRAEMAHYRNSRFIVLHDAHAYFERFFDVRARAAITIDPDTAPGVARVTALRQMVATAKITCIFGEAGIPDKWPQLVADGHHLSLVQLDPLGITIGDGPGFFPRLFRLYQTAYRDCLKGAKTG